MFKARYSSLRFNPKTQRYIGPDGRFLSRAGVSGVIQSDIQGQADNLRNISQGLQQHARAYADGYITEREWRQHVASWRQIMAENERDIDLNYACAARGGTEQMDARSYGRAGSRIKKRLRYLDDFAQEIATNPFIVLDEVTGKMSFMDRVQLHADAGWFTYTAERADAHKQAGFTRRRNVPHSQESCRSKNGKIGCVELTELGWQDINDPNWREVGDRTCGPKDRCDEEFDMGDVKACLPWPGVAFYAHGGY